MPEGTAYLRNRELVVGRTAQATFLLSNEVEEELGRETSTKEQNRWNENTQCPRWTSRVRICSGRKPTPITRAGIRRNNGKRPRRRMTRGSFIGAELSSTRRMTLFCTAICSFCVARVGNSRRRCTDSR